MSLRAYYRNPAGDLTLPQDSGRPVPEEKLRALGCKWWELESSPDERTKAFKELSKSLGFKEGDFEHFWDLGKQAGMPSDPAMGPKDVLESIQKEKLTSYPALVLYITGNYYADMKEPGTDSYIRLAIPPNCAIFYPAGTIFQGYHTKDNLNVVAHTIYKTTDPTSVFIFGEGMDEHPTRVEYVKSVLSDVGN